MPSNPLLGRAARGYDAPVRAGDLSHRGEPFCKLLVRELPFGTLAAISLPEGRDPVPDRYVEDLPEEERPVVRQSPA